MKNIFIITSILPDKYNRNGPSGLIWEICRVLQDNNYNVKIKYIKSDNKFNKMGLFIKKYYDRDELNNENIILVYPFNLYFKLKKENRLNAIVLGPDSPSLLFSRLYKNSINIFDKIKYLLLLNWFFIKEKRMLLECKKFIVVGEIDRRWVASKNREYSSKVFYLTHPVLQSIIEEKNKRVILRKNNNETILVLAGDLSKKYVYKQIINFFQILKNINNKIIIVGKKGKWIFDKINKMKRNIRVEYTEWIENYGDICNPYIHIHLIPLGAGAGTKNRTLSACAMGVPIISTFIGLENIKKLEIKNTIFEYKNAINIIKFINIINDMKQENVIKINTDYFIKTVNENFKKELLNYLI